MDSFAMAGASARSLTLQFPHMPPGRTALGHAKASPSKPERLCLADPVCPAAGTRPEGRARERAMAQESQQLVGDYRSAVSAIHG
jgi:hypothetical protein